MSKAEPHPPVLDDATIAARLQAELPHWRLEGGWIKRTYKTGGWKATLMVIGAVGHVAEVAWHHPDLEVSYSFVTVKLKTHAAKGITERDLALARQIETVITWRPPVGGVLEGTPDDPRLRYLRGEG